MLLIQIECAVKEFNVQQTAINQIIAPSQYI